MATTAMIRHGSEAGYRAELESDSVCERCRKGHQMYDRLSRTARRTGSQRPDRYTPLDSQWTPSRNAPQKKTAQNRRSSEPPAQPRPSVGTVPGEDPQFSPVETSTGPEEPSLGDRLAERIRSFTINGSTEYAEVSPEYVPEESTGYVHTIDDVDDPGPGWEPAPDSEYIITAQGLKTIEQNLGTYLSVVGITVEMIDPYCGPILAQNFDNIVNRWSKVIAHYPKAAELFLDGKGGIVFTWIGALQATWPVLYAIYQHHLAKTVMVTPDGRIYQKGQMPNPNGSGDFDPLRPDFQYSAT